MIQPPNHLETFEALLEVVKALRGPEGCPWDKEQTHRTLTPYAIEEAHELAEAIETGDQNELIGELGDVLLQVVLHAEIGRQENRFDISDVIRSISEKMVRRHPHVFSTTEVADSQDVLKNWAQIKDKEKAQKNSAGTSPGTGESQKRFDVALSLPALSRSQKIGEKTKRLRFDWSNATEVLKKVDEELAEVKAEMNQLSRSEPAAVQAEVSPELRAALEHEVGDLLFSVAQLARHLGLEAEQCLRTANSRFETRFFTMKKLIEDSGKQYDDLSAAELEEAWQNVKSLLKN